MTSLEENGTSEPTVKKKKKACTKRKILKDQKNFESTSIYSVANIRSLSTFQLPMSNGDSDEEENFEQFQAKLNARIRNGKPLKSKKGKQSTVETISDTEDDRKTPDITASKVPSPSPPPPPPLEYEEPRRSRRLESTVRNLDKAYFNAVSQQTLPQRMTPTSSSFDEQNQSSDVDLDSSFEIAKNRSEMTVKVRTKRGLKRFTLSMHEPLIKIIISLAEEEKVDVNNLSLTRNAEQLSEGDTPASLNLTVTDILDCVVIDPSSVPLEDISELIPDEDKVDIKFQGQEKKSVFNFTLPKDEPLKRAFEAYSKFISLPQKKLKFWFDGEEVTPFATPEDLEMEEQGTIDVTRH